jgi:predicted metal-binding protein
MLQQFAHKLCVHFVKCLWECRVKNALHLNTSNKSSEYCGAMATGSAGHKVVSNKPSLIGFK